MSNEPLFDQLDNPKLKAIRPAVLTPEEVELVDQYLTGILQCPHCGHRDNLDGFDVLGADDNCVFCNGCNRELEL